MKKILSILLPAVVFVIVLICIVLTRQDLLSKPLTEEGNAVAPPYSMTLPVAQSPLSESEPIAPIDPLPLPREVLGNASHAHAWRLVKNQSATCTVAGETVWTCACGETVRETVPVLAHSFVPADCERGATCSVCGAVASAPLGHCVSGAHCTRCQQTFSQPLFVCNHEFSFGETSGTVTSKIGSPTEILYEGGYQSFVYVNETTPLTVFQFSDDTLAGVFSFDPALRFHLGDRDYTMAAFSGSPDAHSNAYAGVNPAGKLYGFCDDLADGACYALWVYQGRLDYDYINNSRIYQNYHAQARLAYYLVNALRKRAGLSPLLWSPAAASVASEYCAYMETNAFFAHDHSYAQRLTEKGVTWSFSGENLSQGYFNAYFVSDAYYHSSSHRDNLLHEKYTHIGTAFERVETIQTVYGSQVFYS